MSASPRNEVCAGCRWMRNSNTERGVAECSVKNLQVDSTAPGKSVSLLENPAQTRSPLTLFM